MKNLLKLLLLVLIASIMTNCKKSTISTNVGSGSPKNFGITEDGFAVVDNRNHNNGMFYDFEWNNTTNKYSYNINDTFSEGWFTQHWPSGIADPVNIDYFTHFIDRANGSVTHTILYRNGSDSTGTLAAEFPGLPADWQQPNKIDGAARITETYGTTSTSSQFFFDLDAGKYILYRNGAVMANEDIANLIILPKGTLTTTTIDFTKADAVIGDLGREPGYYNTNVFFFIDYDAMKYVEIRRINDIATDVARNSLVTNDWTPLSNLIADWKF